MNLFVKYDTDRDGKINQQELEAALEVASTHTHTHSHTHTHTHTHAHAHAHTHTCMSTYIRLHRRIYNTVYLYDSITLRVSKFILPQH